MNKTSAKIISYIFHPLLLPTYLGLIILNTDLTIIQMYPYYQKLIIGLIFMTTFVLPLTAFPLLYNLRVIHSIEMKERKERIIPLIFTLLAYSFGTYMILRLPVFVPSILTRFLLSSTVLVFITLIITYRWKISIHMIGIGGLTGVFLAISNVFWYNTFPLLLGSILMAGFVGTARLKLDTHSPSQIFTGFLIGVSVIFVSMVLI